MWGGESGCWGGYKLLGWLLGVVVKVVINCLVVVEVVINCWGGCYG